MTPTSLDSGTPRTHERPATIVRLARCLTLAAGALAGASCGVPSLVEARDGQDAAALYRMHCASCHGKDGGGGVAPSLLLGTWRHGADDASIARVIRDGVEEDGMPAFGEVLGDGEVRGLVIYLRELAAGYQRRRATLPAPGPDQVFATEEHAFRMEVVADGLATPWSIAWLPDGRMLVTEKGGTLRVGRPGALDPRSIAGTPAVYAEGQGGLLEVAVHPDHARNGWIYLAFSDPLERLGRNASLTKVIRGRLRDHALVDQETIWAADPAQYVTGNVHWGTRIAFKDGYLFFSHGDRGRQQLAQDLAVPVGKVHRVHDDGRVPRDNPFVGVEGAVPTIWTYGNRNPQGLAIHPVTGDLWQTEHGPRGGDELNLLRRGANHGWPVITHGMNYDGTPITAETARDGMEQPVVHWTPSIAVCGIDFYDGDRFPGWRGDLLVTALAQQHLRRVVIGPDNRVVREEILFADLGRVRDVSTGPDGFVYVALNSPDRIVRLVPASP